MNMTNARVFRNNEMKPIQPVTGRKVAPELGWATFRPTNGRKVARLQHLFLGGRPSARLTDGKSRVYNICVVLCFPPKIVLPPGIPNYIEAIFGGKVGSWG